MNQASAAVGTPNVIEFITDPQLVGLSLSPAQEALLRAIYGLTLTSDQLDLYRLCTGREAPPAGPFGEVTVLSGSRAGKGSRIAAPIVLYEAFFGGHQVHLHRGERGVIPLVAQDERGTKVAFGYVRDYLTRSPLLAGSVAHVHASEIELENGLVIHCFPCTLRSLRGWSIPCGVMDELGFYRLEGAADSDAEIQASIRRGMIGFPSPRLVKVSTPYLRSGILYQDFARAFGQDHPDLLVWRASTALMNPAIAADRLERMRRLDPARFSREFDAEFIEDLEAFLPPSWVEDAVVSSRRELPPEDGVQYVAACDPSGGGADAFTLAIVHAEGGNGDYRIVHDAMRGRARIGANLAAVVAEYADLLQRYAIPEVVGDRYAGQWVRAAFQEHGIAYLDTPVDKSAAYLEIEPFFAQGRIDLLDNTELIRELKGLERRLRAGGRTLIDHPRGGHDDYANALALAARTLTAETLFGRRYRIL